MKVMLSVLRKFGEIIEKKDKRKLFGIFALMLVGAVLETLGVSLMFPLLYVIVQPSVFLQNGIIQKFCLFFDITSQTKFIVVCLCVIIVVFIVKNIYLMVEYYVQYKYVYKMRYNTQKELLTAFISRPYEFFLDAKSGDIIRTIEVDAVNAYGLLATLLGFATESIVVIGMFVTIFVANPKIVVGVVIIMVLIGGGLIKVISPILNDYGIKRQKSGAQTYKWVQQSINGIKEVKITQKEAFFVDEYSVHSEQAYIADKWLNFYNQIPRLSIEMFSIVSMFGATCVLILMGEDIQTLIPALGVIAMAAVRILPSANRIIAAFNTAAYSEPSVNVVFDNLSYIRTLDNKILNKDDNVALKIKNDVCLKSIRYKYPNTSKYVICDANVKIPVGKSVGIIGASGAGKTTIVDLLLGLLKIESGEILADGESVFLNYKKWLKNIGYIPQMIFLSDDTIRANVAFGEKSDDVDDNYVWGALKEAKLDEFVRNLPNGLDTQIGERGIRLSGGQRQRIGIARALYNDPDLLILDEATSALDNETEAAIMDSINALHGKKTMIIIAHRLTTIEKCDIVYSVENGNVINISNTNME